MIVSVSGAICLCTRLPITDPNIIVQYRDRFLLADWLIFCHQFLPHLHMSQNRASYVISRCRLSFFSQSEKAFHFACNLMRRVFK